HDQEEQAQGEDGHRQCEEDEERPYQSVRQPQHEGPEERRPAVPYLEAVDQLAEDEEQDGGDDDVCDELHGLLLAALSLRRSVGRMLLPTGIGRPRFRDRALAALLAGPGIDLPALVGADRRAQARGRERLRLPQRIRRTVL